MKGEKITLSDRINTESEVKNSGNSFNIIYIEQSSAVAVGLIAIAAALTGGISADGANGPANTELVETMNRVMNEALEADRQNREQFLDALRSMNANIVR